MNDRFEHWVWTELLAFDCTRPDCGAAEYLQTLGFVPEGVCLLLTTLDFALSHKGMEREYVLPPDFCSRNGHRANEVRTRQEWTNYQLRTLVAALKQAGCKVFYSSFSTAMLDRFHREWVCDHPEVRGVYSWYDGDPQGRGNDVCLVKDLEDGTPVARVFAERLVKCCLDYGFDGFHGADGCGPWWASGTESDMSDNFLAAFLQDEWNVPDFMKAPMQGGLPTLIRRSEWVWANRRLEWFDYVTKCWARAWSTISGALHAAGLLAVINSANTRASFDAIYETGVNYRMMAQSGIDAMVVETVALGIELSSDNVHPHDDYPAALREIRTFAPQFKLIFLHGIKDVVENWDNLRQAPCAYERELCRLANSYAFTASGMERAASGLLGCLADGIKASEWESVRKLWATHIAEIPVAAGEVVTLHTDSQIEAGLADYTRDGMPTSHDEIRLLMEHGLAVETAARIEFAAQIPGVRLLPSAHLVPDVQIAGLLRQEAVTALCGRAAALERYFAQGETLTDGRIALVILNGGSAGAMHKVEPGSPVWEQGPLKVRFCEYRPRMDICDEFWSSAVTLLRQAAQRDAAKRGLVDVALIDSPRCTLQYQRLGSGALRITVENRAPWRRVSARLRFSRPVADVKMLTAFPVLPIGGIAPGGALAETARDVLALPVPPHGVTSAIVTFA